jgi:hypothetical protein
MTITYQVELRHNLAAGETSLKDGVFSGVIFVAGPTTIPGLTLGDSAVKSGADIFPGALMFNDHGYRTPDSAVGRVLDAFAGEVDGNKALMGKYFISESREDLRLKIAEGIISEVSLSALTEGEIEIDDDGQETYTVTGFKNPQNDHVYPPSVDLVTYGAAEGQIALSRTESAGEEDDVPAPQAAGSAEEDSRMTDQDLQALNERLQAAEQATADLRAQNEALELSMTRQAQVAQVTDWLEGQLENRPDSLQARIRELAHQPLQTLLQHGGATEDVEAQLSTLIDTEVEYFTHLHRSGMPGGGSTPDNPDDLPDFTDDIAALLGGND